MTHLVEEGHSLVPPRVCLISNDRGPEKAFFNELSGVDPAAVLPSQTMTWRRKQERS